MSLVLGVFYLLVMSIHPFTGLFFYQGCQNLGQFIPAWISKDNVSSALIICQLWEVSSRRYEPTEQCINFTLFRRCKCANDVYVCHNTSLIRASLICVWFSMVHIELISFHYIVNGRTSQSKCIRSYRSLSRTTL